MSKKLNTQEAADFLGLRASTLEAWRCRKLGPRYAKLGRRVLYDQNDLEIWFASRSVITVDRVRLRRVATHES